LRDIQRNLFKTIVRRDDSRGTSEERIRLMIPRLPLGHESSKEPEFTAEWMVN
jgi:hypothetical protein